MRTLLVAALCLPIMAACGQGGLSGEYGNADSGEWRTVLSLDGDAVAVAMPDGTRLRGTVQSSDGKQIVIVLDDGQTVTLQVLADGCLDSGVDDGLMLGKICGKS